MLKVLRQYDDEVNNTRTTEYTLDGETVAASHKFLIPLEDPTLVPVLPSIEEETYVNVRYLILLQELNTL